MRNRTANRAELGLFDIRIMYIMSNCIDGNIGRGLPLLQVLLSHSSACQNREFTSFYYFHSIINKHFSNGLLKLLDWVFESCTF